MSISENVKLLSLATIAGWQTCLPRGMPDHGDQVHAELPALQRGFVWKPSQVENLWDSLLREFPIGSFLLSQIHKNPGVNDARSEKSQKFKLDCRKIGADPADGNKGKVSLARFDLLDGQQRATAIALGFVNPWKCKSCDYAPPAVLWVDLVPPPLETGMEYLFRVCTRSHPWGYKSDRSERLEARDRCNAFGAYVAANSDVLAGLDYTEIPLTYTWPWDAQVPLPVSLLLESLINTKVRHWREDLKERITCCLRYHDEGMLITKRTEQTESEKSGWLNALYAALKNPSSKMGQRLEILADEFRKTLTGISIPALLLPRKPLNADKADDPSLEKPESEEAEDQDHPPPDPEETMFVRINSGGTPLAGEELLYSIYKAIWPDSVELVERIGRRFVVPSRLVALAARLVLARTNLDAKKPPEALNVSRFRRLVHGDVEFRKGLEEFLHKDAQRIFESAYRLMVGDSSQQNRYYIGAILAADIAQRAPDVFFLLLRWIDRMGLDIRTIAQLSDDRQRSILGIITGLSWFATDQAECIRTLWPKQDNKEPASLFTWKYMKQILGLKENGGFKMLFLLPPGNLDKVLRSSLPARCDDEKWANWNWYTDLVNAKPKGAIRWYDGMAMHCWNEEHLQDGTKREKTQEAWSAFMDRLWRERRLILYAQRHWLSCWFSGFDPTSPDQLEDTDRPWDWDHIFPTKYIYNKRGLPRMLQRDWHWTIGNIRAWPLQANRSDGELLPKEKLSEGHACRTMLKSISGEGDLLAASFIGQELRDWIESSPEDGDPVVALKDATSECRQKLLSAITRRLISLYRQWYDELNIKKVFGGPEA